MTSINYSSISVLIADDFGSFRRSVDLMLQSLGLMDIEKAATPEEVVQSCARRFFDLILCDYNLGSKRTGQHVLEELRYRRLLTSKTVFILVSAEASRNIVMSAYDCKPDDYLMKPINTQTLQQRMERLLVQRQVFSRVYAAMEQNEVGLAIDMLVDMSLEQNRHGIVAQKLLGELFLLENMHDKAERLYTRALEVCQLDWARLGLARVKQARGEWDKAGSWLEKIINESPFFLPAYDTLATNWEKKGDKQLQQFTLQKAVDISPMSILRQKKLGSIAQQNNDMHTCIDAFRNVVKLGQHSCYGQADDHFTFARAASFALERKLDVGPSIGAEALAIVNTAKEQYDLGPSQRAQSSLLTGRLFALEGRYEEAAHLLQGAATILEGGEADLDTYLDQVATLLTLGEKDRADKLLTSMKVLHANDQSALEKLDVFLDEPSSESNRAFVSETNHRGIELYNENKFDKALACFESARKLFPKHIGIQLNIVQALIGKMRNGEANRQCANECHASIQLIATLIDKQNPQYNRYIKLKSMASSCEEKL